MALRFVDSFDHYTSNTAFSKKWSEFNGSPAPQSGGARYGAGGMQHTCNTYWRKVIDSQATWIVGIAFRHDTVSPIGTDPLFTWYDDTTKQVYLSVNTSKRLVIFRGDGTTLGTGTTALSASTWYYIEFKVTINNSTGVAIARINGVDELNLTSQDTQISGNATANKLMIQGDGGSSDTFSTDDLYVCDGTGGDNNDFLGDVRIEYIEPNGNGNSSGFTGSDGNSTDNYLLVDEANPNDDTDYVTGGTVGTKDTYAFDNLVTVTGNVKGVQIGSYRKKDNAGSKSDIRLSRLSGTELDSAAVAVSDTYSYAFNVQETKPGGGAWSIADVNSAEFGVKVAA